MLESRTVVGLVPVLSPGPPRAPTGAIAASPHQRGLDRASCTGASARRRVARRRPHFTARTHCLAVVVLGQDATCESRMVDSCTDPEPRG